MTIEITHDTSVKLSEVPEFVGKTRKIDVNVSNGTATLSVSIDSNIYN